MKGCIKSSFMAEASVGFVSVSIDAQENVRSNCEAEHEGESVEVVS
jgi:hypothetical protein